MIFGQLKTSKDFVRLSMRACDFLDGLRQIASMVAIGVEENFKRHSEITSCLPWICTSLYQPGRRGVSQRMRGYSGTKPCEPNGTLERRFDRGYRPSVVLDEMLRLDQSGPAPQVSKQAEGNRDRRLPLVGFRTALNQTVVAAAL